MNIPFTKAHGAGNDFLLTWAEQIPGGDLQAIARAICDRHIGIGGDGWILVRDASIRLFNADGSEAEISGNGTRCAAALLIDSGRASNDVTINTGAGPKALRLIQRSGRRFLFEMNMGQPVFQELRYLLPLQRGAQEVTILDVGNPQCAVLVDRIPDDWKALGAEIEAHPHFPKRTNASFVRAVDAHTIEARFYEQGAGAGATLSSGTGATGAAVAAILRKVVESPVRIITEGEELQLRWDDSVYLTGPAEIVGAGDFYFAGTTAP